MSSDNFDNEITRLYQQRKAQVVAPQVSFKAQSILSQLSPLSILAIFSAATVASFSIMAVINHLSNTTVKKAPLYNKTHQVEIAEPITVNDVEKVILIQPPLPPKPDIKGLVYPTLLDIEQPDHKPFNGTENLPRTPIQRVILPQLQEPQLAITPTYKVLPKYRINSKNPQETGEIKLNYNITSAGTVSNINVVKSSVSRPLEIATKKALSKWRYTPSNTYSGSVDILFEFKTNVEPK